MTSIVIFSEDDAFIEQIRQATNMPVIDYEITTRTNYSQGYEYIFIIDATTVEVSVDLLNQEKFRPAFQILITGYDDHDTIEQFADKVSDIWHKPIHPAILRKRLDYARIVPDAGRHILEYIGYFNSESRAPLASVKGYAEVMISGMTGELTEQQIAFLKTIQHNAKRLGNTLEDLRDEFAIKSGRFNLYSEAVDLYELAKIISDNPNKLHVLQQSIIEINIAENLPAILADPTRLSQVIDVVISNAYNSPQIMIDISRSQDVILFKIQDFGEHSYRRNDNNPEEFSFTNYYFKTIVDHIIKEHGGKMWLEQGEDSSTFHFTIPIAQENTPDD